MAWVPSEISLALEKNVSSSSSKSARVMKKAVAYLLPFMEDEKDGSASSAGKSCLPP